MPETVFAQGRIEWKWTKSWKARAENSKCDLEIVGKTLNGFIDVMVCYLPRKWKDVFISFS